ncbi:MAG: hypothetical protein C5B53_04410 [Candidatus Melainabacteria bacterium]|nr:MAG: hypothetical protein C5B53_04410 [Candidatus Melainabacteria bacterium]
MKHTFHRSRSGRKPLGVGFVVLTLFIAAFMILPAGLLAFELMRYNLITQELRNVTDAAALAGSAAIASAPKDLSLAAIHDLAIETAAVTFEQNSVGTTRFGPHNVDVHAYDARSGPPTNAHTAVLNISLEDYDGNFQERGSNNAKRVRVNAQYRETPAFAAFIGLQPTFVTNAVAVGGLPKLDLFICFDLSGSMDDQTQISLVKRFWNGAKKPEAQMVEYQTLASDTIKNVFRPPTAGSAVNAFWPQNLSYGAYGGLTGNGTPWIWSEGAFPNPNKLATLRAEHGATPPDPMPPDPPLLPKEHVVLFSVPEQGKPPGNFDPDHPDDRKGHKVDPDIYPNGYTDLVCKVQDNSGFSYPNVETCLEASRGNLENKDVFNKSKGGEKYKTNPALKGIVPKHGYYVNYWTQVQTSRQPFNQARDALFKFLETTNLSADVHFGLDTFSNTAGIASDDNWRVTWDKIDARYDPGGFDTYPLPLLDLDQRFSKMGDIFTTFDGTGIGNIDKIPDSHILGLGPTGTTHIAVSLQLAVDQLTNPKKSRSDAKKAILLFTDGVANEPVDVVSANSLAMKQAKRACDNGIPIYTVGFAQNPDILPLQREFLGDGHSGSGRGLAYESGNHAVYIPVTDAKDLVDAFRSVARSMAVLRPAKSVY